MFVLNWDYDWDYYQEWQNGSVKTLVKQWWNGSKTVVKR